MQPIYQKKKRKEKKREFGSGFTINGRFYLLWADAIIVRVGGFTILIWQSGCMSSESN